MKILISEDTAYGYATGAAPSSGNGKWQWLLARALVEAGWSAVVGVRTPLRPGQEEVVSGVRFVGMGEVHTGMTFLPAWSRLLSAERPDWWYWQGADPLWGVMLLIAKAKGVRGIFSAASDADIQPQMALTRRSSWWPLYALGLRSVERIFVQHDDQLGCLGRGLQHKARVVPGVVSIPDKVKAHAERGGYAAWVGNLIQPKRPDILIKMARQTPDLRYVVCGGMGTYRTAPGYGEAMAEELGSLANVEYMGHVDPRETLEIIGNANALVSTSDLEGFPNTFLEAWSAGTPVVSLQVDPGDVIEKRALGFVSGTIDKAASDVRRLLTASEAFEAVSKRALIYVDEVHSGAAVVRVLETAIGGSVN